MNQIQFFIYDGAWYTSSLNMDSSFNGEWHHAAGTYFDGTNIEIYLDGVLDGSAITTESIGVNVKSMFIGDNPDATGRYWDGLVDELKIYNRALSDEEILYLAGN